MPWHGFLIDSFFYFTNAVFLFEISQKGFIPRNLKKIQNEVDNIVVSIVIGKKKFNNQIETVTLSDRSSIFKEFPLL